MQDNSIPENNEIPYGYCHCGCGEKTRMAPKTDASRGWIRGEPVRFVVYHGTRKPIMKPFRDNEQGCYVVPLSDGSEALVDDRDVSLVSSVRWSASRGRQWVYARGWHRSEGVPVSMHRLIMSPPSGMQVDHINGNGLDNRRSNLRLVSNQENSWNRKAVNKNNTSSYIGVTFAKGKPRPWVAQISHGGRGIYIGHYDTAEEAARARDEKAIELRGELATLNFPRT